MSRRQIREIIFNLLFRIEFHQKDELEEQLDLVMESLDDITEKDHDYIVAKATAIKEKLEELDTAINEAADKWKTSRMAKAELAIIRLAVYEMKFEDDIPTSVSINEAVELAKKYGGDKGPAFVNGVLAKMV